MSYREVIKKMELEFSDRPPYCLVLDRGSTKTEFFRELVKMGYWDRHIMNPTTYIVPVLWPQGLSGSAMSDISAARNRCFEAFGADRKYDRRGFEGTIAEPRSLFWPKFWVDEMSRIVGLTYPGVSIFETLKKIDHTVGNRKPWKNRVIFLFDGLEDAFPDLTHEHSVHAVRGLVNLVNLFMEVRHIGIIVMARRATVKEVIVQNFGQLESRFREYTLN